MGKGNKDKSHVQSDKSHVSPADYFRALPSDDVNGVNATGNSDAKILAKVFEELSKDGLTGKERQKIEQFDQLLENADIIINKDGSSATIVQEDGHTYKLNVQKGRVK